MAYNEKKKKDEGGKRKRNVNPKGEEVNVAVEAELYPTGTTAR